MEFWSPKVNEFRKAIWEYVCFDNEGRQDIHVPFDRFRVYGWIDCLMHLMCMPGSGPINDNDERNENAFDIQRAYFSNYAKGWGMKTQAVGLPNGMFGSIFFTSLTHNDKGVVNISGIEEELERVLEPYKLFISSFHHIHF